MEYKWNLNDIVEVKDFKKLKKEIRTKIKKTGYWSKKLKPEMSKKDFNLMMDWWQGLEEKVSRLAYLPHLMEEANQKNRLAKNLKIEANDTMLQYSKEIRPIAFWLKGLAVAGLKKLDDKNAKRLFEATTDLKWILEQGRRLAKYSLEIREEEIVDNKDVYGIETVLNLREMMETEMEYEMKVEGKTRKIKTQGELMKYVHSEKKTEREGAYRSLFAEHKKHIDKLHAVLVSAVKNWDYEAKLRGFKSPISRRNVANQVPDEAIEALLKACTRKGEIFGKFWEYKAKNLGVNKLSRFDLYAPMKKKVEEKQKKYDFEETKRMVLETMYGFTERFGQAGEKIITDGHIDSHPRINKRSGAFCATVGPKITPYVLLNHDKTLRSVYTLAHELGHGIHSLYANCHGIMAQQSGLPLAETASTLAETVLFEKLLEKENNKEAKKSMLWEKISDSYATILRQNYFIKFELELHEKMKNGLGIKETGELWLRGLKEQFGKRVEVDGVFANEWSYIPHIVASPFYCYAYSFGELLSLSLYKRYKKEGKSFVAKIEKILEAGGSEDPEKVLKRVGIEMKDESFWEGGFEIVEGWIDELI
jgi:oligoendopeptidase F